MIELSSIILVPRPLTSKREGQTFLESYIRHFPRQLPQKFGEVEPLRKKFDAAGLESALSAWGQFAFIAERRNPGMQFQILFAHPSRKPAHASISVIRFQAEDENAVSRFEDFVCDVATTFEADLAVAHILTRTELEDRVNAPESGRRIDVPLLRTRVEREGFARVLWGMTVLQNHSLKIRQGLPGLYWLTVFGRPYINLFGYDRLLETPAKAVQELSNGSVKIKLTNFLRDDKESWQEFRQVRERCKDHLGRRAFLDHSARHVGDYQVPQFQFPIELYLVDHTRSE